MDCWKDIRTPAEHLAQSKKILETFLPWESRALPLGPNCTDANRHSRRRVQAPTVRAEPIGRLPSGAAVLGLAGRRLPERMDPITGWQGSNNASKAAKTYLDAILAFTATGHLTPPSCRLTFDALLGLMRNL